MVPVCPVQAWGYGLSWTGWKVVPGLARQYTFLALL